MLEGEGICHNIMPHHATLNHIMIHVTTLMRTLKTEHDVCETSQSVMIGSQTNNGILVRCKVLLNDNNSIPLTVFSNNSKMRTVWELKPNSIPFLVEPMYNLVQN